MHATARHDQQALARWQAMVAAEQTRQAAVEQEILRQNSPDYVAVTRDGRGAVQSVFQAAPNGNSVYRGADGSVSTRKVIIP